jgi:glycosyltransferase involved in cell wall biosynthesis
LHFVSQPGVYNNTLKFEQIISKYKIDENYFFLPNQLWKHKNHMVVFKALTLLKKNGISVCVVCTGQIDDYRNNEYSHKIKQYIQENELNVKLLGIIDYQDVVELMRNSIAVINPSYFEGWSSTVEECKSLGKNMILSDINVHKEQAPDNSYYFNPDDENELYKIIFIVRIEVITIILTMKMSFTKLFLIIQLIKKIILNYIICKNIIQPCKIERLNMQIVILIF